MDRLTTTDNPYVYPALHVRRHGPIGYTSYDSYRPWLEDEFSFRCIYCLKRMVWAPTDVWAVDHLVPREEAAHLACDYDNLVLSCQHCNRQKSWHRVPDPCKVAYGSCIQVDGEGLAIGLNAAGRRLVETIRLNHRKYVEERRKVIKLLRVLEIYSRDEFERWLGFPSELHNLASLRPPGGNRRPHGLSQSLHALKERGELPHTY